MTIQRITPQWITLLQPDEVFVFGSNLQGLHAGGAAKLAMQWGAVWGKGVGLQGQTYAIPTMQGGVDTIRPHVDEFISLAKQHPNILRHRDRLWNSRIYRRADSTSV